MRKFFVILLLAIFVPCLIVGCGGKPAPEDQPGFNSDPDPDAIDMLGPKAGEEKPAAKTDDEKAKK